MLRKKISKTIQDISKRKLSIQFSLDGFSFCIANSSDELYEFVTYHFEEKANTPQEVLKNIAHLFSTEPLLQDDFESILVIHENNLNTLVPNDYFLEEHIKGYLKFTVKTIPTDYIAYDDVDVINSKNVYIPYVNINNFLFQNFGEFEYKHHTTVLIEKLSQKITAEQPDNIFVNISSDLMDIVIFNDQKLVFTNSFEYQTKEDFIYYILFVMEQLKYNPDTASVTLLGDLNKESDLFKISYTYIRNIQFLECNNRFLKGEESFSDHSHYTLLG